MSRSRGGRPPRQRIVVPFAGHTIGEGFNSDSGERPGVGLNVGKVGEDPVASGQTATFRFQMLTSQSSMEKALNIGAELEARYGLFSGGAKVDFAESSAVNSASTYILASVVVANALSFGSDFTPTATAQRLIDAGDKDGFKAAFGDRFTQALHTGGEFHAVVRITSSSVVHQQRISASLHAELNGLFTTVSFSGAYADAQNDASSHTEVDIQVHQTGGVGDQVQIPGTEADRIRDHMNRFAQAAKDHAGAYEAELLTYDTLALPFPPAGELEDKRRVLEDCLARRQTYWSAISDLAFTQTKDARLIFDDLLPDAELLALQNQFRTVLNALMAHARAVARGTIPPDFFIADHEPVLPRFKRKDASSFASWWARARSNDPSLLQDERQLIDDIGSSATELLSVPLDQASPETMERAVDTLTWLYVNIRGNSSTTALSRRSLADLPRMLDAPLRTFSAYHTLLEDLVGLEGFTRLESVSLIEGQLRDLGALESLAGLRELVLSKQQIVDLSPLRGLTSLQALNVEQNMVEDLGPLEKLANLESVSILSNSVLSLHPLGELPKLRSLNINGRFKPEHGRNPVLDARSLAKSLRLSNVLTSADRVRLVIYTREGSLIRAGLATRVRDTNRFELTQDGSSSPEAIEVQGLTEWRDFNLFPAPVVATAVRFLTADVGIACTHPDDRSTFLPAAELARAVPSLLDVAPFLSEVMEERPTPGFLIEASAA